MFKKGFWKKGGAEIVGFVLVLPFLILPLANTVYMLTNLVHYDTIRQASRDALLRMEIEGGLTSDAVYTTEAYFESKGLDINKIHIDYTPYPVEYGDEVRIRISYEYTKKRYTIGLGGIRRVDENATMAYGPLSSVSKKYER
ncbi:hypothetical protein [Tepidanaerobacter acetatoxydans]|uniref:hypothetical protein n=1 Tax=Tepidanaerobacter acetatoxydans TaxID=499229 RepID=UPI001BD6CE9A|nr:hypothetical protein [Tepidanaerobacter acetatoxydans]